MGHKSAGRTVNTVRPLLFVGSTGNRKTEAGTQDERSEGLSPSRGREHLVDLESQTNNILSDS